jgi:hypothetical protein
MQQRPDSARQPVERTGAARPRFQMPISRAHLFWLLFAVIVAGIFLTLYSSMGTFITVAGIDVTPVMLGEVGAIFLAGSMAYTLRKRLFIGGHGQLSSWLWAHVYLGLLGVFFIWYHSRQRFSPNQRLANTAMVLLILTVLAGIAGCALYALIPPLLHRLPDYDPPDRLRQRIDALEVEASALAALKSAEFRAAYERLLRQAPEMAPSAPGWKGIQDDRTGVAREEAGDFDRVTALLVRRAELMGTLRRREGARTMLGGWWKIHERLTEAALILAGIHIIASLLIDHRWK